MTHSKLRKLYILFLMTTTSIPLFQIRLVQAQSNIPQVIHSCITTYESKTNCEIWQWNGSHYEIIEEDGRISTYIMEVEHFDKDLVVIYSIPPYLSRETESVERREKRYEGNPNGNQIKNGIVQDRHSVTEGKTLYTWNARW